MRTFFSRIKSAIRRTLWRISPPSMPYVVALIGRLGVGTVEDFAQHFNINTEDVGKLFQNALEAKLITMGRHLCFKQSVFLPTEKGLELGAQEGLLSEGVVALGPCRIGRRNVVQWVTRMRLALEFERLGLEVTTTQELLAEERSTRSINPLRKRSKGKRARCRNRMRQPDLRVRAIKDAPSIAVNVQFNLPIFKRSRRELVRNYGVGVIWVLPAHLANHMQEILWRSRQYAAIGLGVKQAVSVVDGGTGNAIVPLNAVGESLLPVKGFTWRRRRNTQYAPA